MTLLILSLLCSLVAAAEPLRAHVVLISIDGLMPATYTEADQRGFKIPTLRLMMTQGAYSTGLLAPMPTFTYPSHTSIATGANPGVHGIVTNNVWDPLEKTTFDWRWFASDIKVPTLWDAARGTGLKTALIGWPVTLGAKADLVVPEFWRVGGGPHLDDIKLMGLLSAPPGLFDATAAEFPGFFDRFLDFSRKDEALTDLAVHAIKTLKPDLLMLHLIEVDSEQHTTGIGSPKSKDAVEASDVQVARVVQAVRDAGLFDSTIFFVVSDHGFAPVAKAFRPGVLLKQKGLVTLDASGHVAGWKAVMMNSAGSAGGSAYFYVRDPKDEQTKRILLETFKPGWAGAVSRAIGHDEIVKLGGDRDAFLAIEAGPGWGIQKGYDGEVTGPPPVAGTHGQFPDFPGLMASFIAFGHGVGRGTVKGGAVIDIGPTVAERLGLKLERAQGRPLALPKP